MLTSFLINEPVHTGYLLIDPANLDHETFSEALPMRRCVPGTLHQAEQLMPRLIDVAALTPAQQDGLGEVLSRELNGDRPPIVCAWLQCPLDVKALSRHLTRFLVGPGPDGVDVLWRYFDPRVLSLAHTVFSADQFEALLGPVVEWRFPWRGRWWSVAGSGLQADPLEGITPAWPRKDQWRSFEASELIESVLNKYQDTVGDGLMTDAACVRKQREADVSIQNAKNRLQLVDPDDLIDYAWHCARWAHDYLSHHKLTSAWGELAQGKINWSDLTSILDKNDYRLLDEYSQMQSALMEKKND